MKISVACCVYNGARFLDEQLRSLVEQTVRPDEIVVVDDVSSDASVAVAEHFARRVAPDVTVVVARNASNQGVVANFEKAIALTTGELVFLCDQDDRWHPEKVETMRDMFEARPDLLLLYTDALLVDPAGAPLPHTLFEALEFTRREQRRVHDGQAFSALLVRNLVTGATAALRRAAFDAARPFPREWIHDEWLAIVSAAIGSVDFLDRRLIDYRQHDANQIGMQRLTIVDKFNKLWVSRSDRYAKLARRSEVLRDRLRAMGARIPAEYIGSVDAKLGHARFRATLPASRLARLAPVTREALTGRYTLYSSGFQGVVRDCLEPS